MKCKLLFILYIPLSLLAQKKPMDHSVYDGWQSIGERIISNDGKWVVYTINPQEGDNNLYIQSSTNTGYKKEIPRGYNAAITEDSRYLVFRIRPLYKDTRDARIKKKRPEEFPKDSIGIIELGKEDVVKVAKIRNYKVPEKASGWLAYHKERDPVPARNNNSPTGRTVDSLNKKIDSLTQLVIQLKNMKAGSKDNDFADEDPVLPGGPNDGTDLVLRNLLTGKEKTFRYVVDYQFNKYGQKLVMRVSKAPRDTNSKNSVIVYDLQKSVADTILKGGNDFKNFAFTEDGSKLAFVAERDTNTKALQKFYELYLYKSNENMASMLIDKKSTGMQLGMTVSENANISFSKSGNRLLFGTAPIQPPKDTSLIEIDLVKLDIWNWKEDNLQSQQLATLQNELRRSYMAVYDFTDHKMEQLGSREFPNVQPSVEGDGRWFVAQTDTGRRIQRQWGVNVADVYAVDVKTGKKTLIKRNHDGMVQASANGKYILLYDNKLKNYFVYDGTSLKNVTSKIKVPLYDEENDVPDDPGPHGIMGWHKDDAYVYLYDKYDIWKVDPTGTKAPELLNPSGRATKITTRYLRLDPEERFITYDKPLYFRLFDDKTKKASVVTYNVNTKKPTPVLKFDNLAYNTFVKAENANAFIYTKESFQQSPNLYIMTTASSDFAAANEVKLSNTNPQQAQYNWGTAELYKWKTFTGQESTGILYKPEDFDSTKKYPMLIYFYEKVSDGLNNYIAPSPTPSRLNIPFFVSRGYLVFTPDISYTKGHPGKDAYNYIVSGAQALAKKKWVDAKNIGIQGQSWGGYQVAHLITVTDMFKAAWAGAPVVNMFSAYGGIRWESGMNRQFQYEKTQSRIGATPWQRPDLYIENSPFFHLPKVKTPVVIMSNDADGAVPWYQGIEFFTAMRRLGKPAWLLNYNGEAHNLVERKNRKDIQIREQQFFDWLLKGEKPPKWITEGVPAVKKGKDWGLEVAESPTL